MKKVQLFIKKKEGFSLVELLISVSVFLIFILAFYNSSIILNKTIKESIEKQKAVFLAEEGLEVLRHIRDTDFSNLIDGNYGLSNTGGAWSLISNPDINDIFTRTINITTINENQKKIISTISWPAENQIDNTFLLETYLTNWRKVDNIFCLNQADFLAVDKEGAILTNSNRTLANIFLENTSPNCQISIDKITLTYTNPQGRRLREIHLNNILAWSGNVSSGEEADIQDFILLENENNINSEYVFNNNVSNRIFTITYTMSDNSVKTIDNINP